MALSILARAWYKLELKAVFMDRKAAEFQSFFTSLMGHRYPDDFVPVTTWGNKGDMKNDGFLKSEKKLFAVYSPNDLKLRKAETKITSDFEGAVTHWSDHFTTWVFVYNYLPGLPAPLFLLLLDLEKKHRKSTNTWGFDAIERLVFQLKVSDLRRLLPGEPVTLGDYVNISFAEISEIVAAIAASNVSQEPIRPVPADKIEKVGLTDTAKEFLKLGMKRADRVAEYFRQHMDPMRGDQVAAIFKNKYRELAATELDPDVILLDLKDFASGIGNRSARNEAAVWAVLAYLFDRCEIFTIEEQLAS